MKLRLLPLCFIAIVLSNCKPDKIPDVYFPGVITIRANSDFRNGMITSLDVFSDDEEFENLGRAIVYKYEEGDDFFDLKDTVFYKIKKGDILEAYDIQKNNYFVGEYINDNIINVKKLFSTRVIHDTLDFQGKLKNEEKYYFNLDKGVINNPKVLSSQNFASMDQIYAMRNKYKLNLHTADNHREGPLHKIRHIRPPKIAYSGTNQNFRDYKAMELYEDNGATIYAIINDPSDVLADEHIDYFLYEKIKHPDLDITPTEFNGIDSNWNNSSKLYDISTSHDHTLGQ